MRQKLQAWNNLSNLAKNLGLLISEKILSTIFDEQRVKLRVMGVFGSNEELVEKIKTQISQIKKKGLSVEEFENLLDETRELYERVLILRYKSFEEHTGKQERPLPVEARITEEPLIIPDTSVEPTKALTQEEQEEEVFGFSLFGEIEENVEKTSDKPVEQTPKETIQPESLIGNTTVPNPAKPATSLLEKLSEQSNSSRLSDKLKLTKINSLSGVFTLNDRIRFSQGLFKGNNEAFQAAIKLLDSLKTRDEAIVELKKMGAEYVWDMESKDVEHFYEYVERLYV